MGRGKLRSIRRRRFWFYFLLFFFGFHILFYFLLLKFTFFWTNGPFRIRGGPHRIDADEYQVLLIPTTLLQVTMSFGRDD